MNAIGHKIKTGKTTKRHKRKPEKLHTRVQKHWKDQIGSQ